jgi:hypothetical protein
MNNRRGGELLASGDGSQKNRKIKQHRTTDRNRVAENRNSALLDDAGSNTFLIPKISFQKVSYTNSYVIFIFCIIVARSNII